jgi:hypothetical protein
MDIIWEGKIEHPLRAELLPAKIVKTDRIKPETKLLVQDTEDALGNPIWRDLIIGFQEEICPSRVTKELLNSIYAAALVEMHKKLARPMAGRKAKHNIDPEILAWSRIADSDNCCLIALNDERIDVLWQHMLKFKPDNISISITHKMHKSWFFLTITRAVEMRSEDPPIISQSTLLVAAADDIGKLRGFSFDYAILDSELERDNALEVITRIRGKKVAQPAWLDISP